MSFDDLAFSGLEAKAVAPVGAPLKVACADCKHDVTVPRARAVRSAFSGLWSVRCPDCNRLIPLPADLQTALNAERKTADADGADGADGAQAGPAGPHGLGAAAAAAAAPAGLLSGGGAEHLMALLHHLPQEFVDFGSDFGGSAANNNMMDLVRAQRGVDIDALMQRLLNSTEHSNIPPTSDAFLKGIKAQVVTARDCVQPLVVLEVAAPNAVGGPKVVTREFVCTTGDGFGFKLVDAHQIEPAAATTTTATAIAAPAAVPTTGSAAAAAALAAAAAAAAAPAPTTAVVQVHATAPVVVSEPLEGDKASNTAQWKGAFVVMRRGKITFADKARAALNAGAKGLLVLQLDDAPWPYSMTDATKAAADITTLPCVMLSAKDGAAVLAATKVAVANATAAAAAGAGADAADKKAAAGAGAGADAAGAGSSAAAVLRAVTRVRGLACSVCRDDFEAGKSEAVKLPCAHFYCETCIRPWLEKRNTCPLCRYELPTDKPKPKPTGPPPVNPAVLQLRENMFS